MKYTLFCVLMLSACVPLTQNSTISGGNPKTLKLIDFAYEPEIKSIKLHPTVGAEADLMPAVAKLGESNLILSFDDLRGQRENYYVKIIHCNHDWTPSTLADLDFMTEYNEFNVTDYQFSIDTHIQYVHYTFHLPSVKLPGNYVAIVYRDGNKDDLILSRRFMVYDNRVTFKRDGNLITSGQAARVNQQINFTINYKGLEIPNPMENVWVVIRQNQRWDNMVADIKPAFIREFERELEYRFFDDKQLFKGGNEFRFFDLRSLNNPGRNIDYVDKKTKPYEVFIQRDKPRSEEAYSQYRDLDGNFFIMNLDYNDINFTNYVYTTFTLMTPKINGNIYVVGAFNYWNQNEENRMQYDTAKNAYTARMLLKQGWYDYQYVVDAPSLSRYSMEGSYFETQNSYEIFVYYKAYPLRGEQLIGYQWIDANAR